MDEGLKFLELPGLDGVHERFQLAEHAPIVADLDIAFVFEVLVLQAMRDRGRAGGARRREIAGLRLSGSTRTRSSERDGPVFG